MSSTVPSLAGAHDLVLVEQEHGHAGRGDELVDLRPSGAERGTRVAVGGGLADAVRLVEDQDVEAVPLGVHELLKYLNIRCTRGARAPATLRRVWVNEREPVACSTVRPRRASSPSSDSAMTLLPLPGPPVTMTIALLSAAPSALDLVHHDRVGEPLLGEEHELLAALDLLRGDRQQLLGGRDAGGEQEVGVGGARRLGVEPFAQEVERSRRGVRR